jgi:hypothetical protein
MDHGCLAKQKANIRVIKYGINPGMGLKTSRHSEDQGETGHLAYYKVRVSTKKIGARLHKYREVCHQHMGRRVYWTRHPWIGRYSARQ